METISQRKELLIKEIDLFLSNKDNFKEIKERDINANITEYYIFEIFNNRLFLFLNVVNTQQHIEKIQVIRTWSQHYINIYFNSIRLYPNPVKIQPTIKKIEILKRDFIPLILPTFSVMDLFYIKTLLLNEKYKQ
jgi:L-rhamnose mutarotase